MSARETAAAGPGRQVRLTPEQKRVVERRSELNFVSAAAGSGKTSLLVECYLRALLDDGLPPEEVVTVTFTRKAAGEMRARVRERLREAGADDLVRRLEAAPIGTIDSFCRRLLAADPLGAGVDPGAAVLDEEQAAMLRHEVWAEVWQRRVAEVDDKELALLATFRRPLVAEVPVLYEKLRLLGQTVPRLLLPSASGLTEALSRLDEALQALQEAAAPEATRSRPAAALLEAVADCRRVLESLDDPQAALGLSLQVKLPLTGPRSLKPFTLEARAAFSALRTALAGQLLAPLAELVQSLLLEFHVSYSARKRAAGYLDFPDLEVQAVSYLREKGSPLAASARLLVDEFQDTNQLQSTLFDLLDTAAVLWVGDEFQSIYGFRGADVEVFRRRRGELQAGEPEARAALGALTYNFRSRKPLLDVLNRLFGSPHLFGASFMPLQAGREDEPHETPAPGRLSPAVELLVVDREEAKAEDEEGVWQGSEARAVAARIAELVNGDGWRPSEVVLLLSAFTHVERYAQALTAAGLPVYVVGGRGYYSREEVTDALALLELLINPHDDRALVTVLRSPLVAVLDDTLVLLRRAAPRFKKRFLWESVLAAAEVGLPHGEVVKLEIFVERLSHLRRHLGAAGLSSLLEEALVLFGYDLAVLAAPEGRRRFANLRKLMRLADEFEAVAGPDLAGLVSYLRQKGDLTAREGSAPTLAEDQDVVRVMTVHQAKGLEFPVVVVAGVGAGGGRQEHPTFLLDKDARLAIVLAGSKAGFEDANLALGPAAELMEQARTADEGESLRLYYVAATRAQERLILAGTLDQAAPAKSPVLQRLLAAAEVGLPLAPGESRPLAGLDLAVRLAAELAEAVDVIAETTLAEEPPEVPPFGLPLGARPTSSRSGLGAVSFSSLSQYATCPFRFYLERILGLRLPQVPLDQYGEGGEAPVLLERGGEDEVGGRQIGSVVHRCLELLPLGEPPAPESARLVLEQTLGEMGLRLSAGQSEDVGRLVTGFWRSPLAVLPSLDKAGKEVPFVFAHGGILINGVLDLLIQEGPHWHVVDYKTNLLEDLSVDEVFVPYLLQSQIYALAGLSAGAQVVETSFLFLQRPESPVRRVYEEADRASLEEALDFALAGLREGSFPRGEGCAGCEPRSLCEALSRGEDRFRAAPPAWTRPKGMV